MSGRGRGSRGRGPGRGRVSSRGAGVIRLPARPATPLISSESAPLEHSTSPTTRRSSRTIQASRNADPDLVESMRPGLVHHHPDADYDGREEEEPTHIDNARERGDDDPGDSDYVERRTSSTRSVATQDHTFTTSSMEVAAPVSRFSAVERTPSRAQAIAVPSRDNAPVSSRSYLPVIPNELLTLLRTPALVENLARQRTASSSPAPAFAREGSASTALSIGSSEVPLSRSVSIASSASLSRSASVASSARASPAPTIPSKRVSTSVEVVDEQQEARRLKKAKQNAARPRHYHYRLDATLTDVLRTSALLVQVHLATVDPFPSRSKRKDMVKDQFNLALEFHEADAEAFDLGTEEVKLLCNEETNMRGRIKRAMARLIPQYGFIRVPRNEQDVNANVALRHKLLGSTPADPYAREPLFHYKNIDMKDGRFLNPIITEVINEAFFGHTGALGCLYQAQFTPFPHPAFALVLTCLEHGIEQYTSGYIDNTMRFSKNYKERYLAHLKVLQQYQHEPLWKKYRKKIVRDGLAYAGAQVEKAHATDTEGMITREEINADMARLAAEELDGFMDSSDVEANPDGDED